MIVLQTVIGLIVLAMALATFRLLRGPGLANRVVALDVMAVLGAALTSLLAIRYDEPLFVDVAVCLALVGFVGTVAFAKYVERSPRS